MKQPRRKIAQVIADKTLKKGAGWSYGREIAAYLLAEGRVSQLNSLLRDVQADWAERGYVEVIATTAHPLSTDHKKVITDQIQAIYPKTAKIIVTEIHDDGVKGGVRLSLADRQLDLSIEAKLNKFKGLTTTGESK